MTTKNFVGKIKKTGKIHMTEEDLVEEREEGILSQVMEEDFN